MLPRFRMATSLAKSQVSFVRLNSTTPAYNEALTKFRGDLKKAMLAKDDAKKTTIRGILSAIKNDEIDGNPKTEYELLRIFKSLIKQRNKSIETYESADRKDLAQKEVDEISIIRHYIDELPIASEEDIKSKIRQLLGEKYPSDQYNGKSAPKIGEVMQLCGNSAEEWKTTPKIVKSLVSQEYKLHFK